MSENKFFFQDKSQYENFIGSWKTATNSEMKHRLTVEHFVLYKMFKGQDWTKCFCPATNLIKMRSQGKSSPYHAANEAMRNIEYAQTHKWIAENMLKPFGGSLTFEEFQSLTIPTNPEEHFGCHAAVANA